MVDIEDPNTWTARYVTFHRKKCLTSIWEIDQIAIRCVRDRNYDAAITGLDRILNGLCLMQDCRQGDYRTFISMINMVEAILLMALVPSHPDKVNRITSTAISALEEARDYAKTTEIKQNANAFIKQIRTGYAVNSQDISEAIGLLGDFGRQIASIM